jgi:dipeptidyl-peptidase-3
LLAEENFMTLEFNETDDQLTVRMDPSKIMSHGKKAISNLLLKFHVHRCTADGENGKPWYEELTAVDDYRLRIRRLVLLKRVKKPVMVMANTFLEEGKVVLKEYDATVDGLVQSWAERAV